MTGTKMIKNIFSYLPVNLPDEMNEVLIENRNVRIERIVSRGHKSPPDFWYDQECDEFVLLIRGKAKLRFEGEQGIISMKAGDYCIIPAHRRHRIEMTSPEEDTIWLAVHY